MAKRSSSSARILSELRRGKIFGAREGATAVGISPDGFRARITELRKAGYSIYTNTATNGVKVYRLGRPTRRVVAAGHFLLSKPGLRKFFERTIEQNLSLA